MKRRTSVGVVNSSLLQLFLVLLHEFLLQQNFKSQFYCVCQRLLGGFDPQHNKRIGKQHHVGKILACKVRHRDMIY